MSKIPTAGLTDDQQGELLSIHGDAVLLASATRFLDDCGDTIERDGEAGVEARGGYTSLVALVATASRALADRIEEFDRAVNRRGGARGTA